MAEPRGAGSHTVHILEPAARDLWGHYFHFCADAAKYLAAAGFQTSVYVSTAADRDELLRELPDGEIVEAFSYLASEPYRRVRSGRVGAADPLLRRTIRHEIIPRLRHVARVLRVRDRVRAENVTFRLDNISRRIAYQLGSSVAERETQAIASQDMRSLLGRGFPPGGNHLFVTTGEQFTLQALADTVAEGGCDALSSIHVRLWQFQSFDSPGADLRPTIVRLTRAADARGIRLFWYCEVPWAQKHLERRLKRPIGYMDINTFKPPVPPSQPASPGGEASSARPPALLFPGAVRRFPDKGLSFISDLAELLAKDPAFTIQMQAIPEQHGDPEFRVVFDRERERMDATGVVDFLPDILDGEQYRQALMDCFAVVIPYDWMTWLDGWRGSGVFLEALLYEKPLFVRRGLPLSKYAGLYDFAEFSTPAELATVARRTLDGTRSFDLAGNRRHYTELLARNDMLNDLRTSL